MTSKKKYSADASLADCQEYIIQLRREHALEVVVLLPTLGAGGSLAAVEVRFYDLLDGPFAPGSKPVHVQRGSVPLKGDAQWSCLMLVISQAWSAYLNDPWSWTGKDRRAAALID